MPTDRDEYIAAILGILPVEMLAGNLLAFAAEACRRGLIAHEVHQVMVDGIDTGTKMQQRVRAEQARAPHN